MREIFAVVKQLKQLRIKPRNNSEAPPGFETMTSTIPVRCSTDWAMKPHRKQVSIYIDTDNDNNDNKNNKDNNVITAELSELLVHPT